MIPVAPGATFEARVEGFPTGLDTVGVQVIDGNNSAVVARTTVGVTETPAGSGPYSVTLIASDGLGEYTIFWDTGVISPSTTAAEELDVEGPSLPAAESGRFVGSEASGLYRALERKAPTLFGTRIHAVARKPGATA
jgi:hypothetical protein